MTAKKIAILKVMIDSVTMAEAVNRAEQFMISNDKPHFLATANAEMIMMANRDTELMSILNNADMVVPDGAGTVWAARHHGHAMPERVAGCDLVQKLLERSAQKGYRVYLLGSAAGVAEKAKRTAEKKYTGIQIVGIHDGYFKEADEAALVEEIKAARPHLLLVALGVPRQEKWIKKYSSTLNVPLSIGVGGTLDVMAGTVKRAPLWMQKAKLEWLYRGLKQPKRAGRLMALPRFVMKVHAEKKG